MASRPLSNREKWLLVAIPSVAVVVFHGFFVVPEVTRASELAARVDEAERSAPTPNTVMAERDKRDGLRAAKLAVDEAIVRLENFAQDSDEETSAPLVSQAELLEAWCLHLTDHGLVILETGGYRAPGGASSPNSDAIELAFEGNWAATSKALISAEEIPCAWAPVALDMQPKQSSSSSQRWSLVIRKAVEQ